MAIDNVSGFMIEAFELYICQQIKIEITSFSGVLIMSDFREVKWRRLYALRLPSLLYYFVP